MTGDETDSAPRACTGDERVVSHRTLVGRLAHGWRSTNPDVAHDLVSRWRSRLSCTVENRETGDGWVTFVSDLGEIKLSGNGRRALHRCRWWVGRRSRRS